jgi:hypothetical protein
MTLLPLSVYGIALSSAFISSGKTFKPLLFALIVLFSAELFWQIISWRKKKHNHQLSPSFFPKPHEKEPVRKWPNNLNDKG